MRRLGSLVPLAAAVLLLFSGACAQDVGDIDRTQPNKLKKADFDGVWYLRHTVVDVPPTVASVFVGIASDMEKVRWEIQEDALIAYRAYQEIPGYDEKAGDKDDGETLLGDGHTEGRDGQYKEEPIAAYPITDHFDVQRQYNSQTGEPTNVVVENRSDRPWHERAYMRVDWTTNLVNYSLPNLLGLMSGLDFYVQQNEGGPDAFYEEREDIDAARDGAELSYFDFTTKLSNGEAEIEVRSSFDRLPDYERDYEPVFYDDELMTKFGYFRTERYVYDRRKGFTDSGIIKLANRHDIWRNDFKRGPDGAVLRDQNDRRIPTPMAEREPKPVVYHLSPHFPEALMPAVEQMEADYDRSFTRAVAEAKGVAPEAIDTPMFVICPNEVTWEAPGVCDPRPVELQLDAQGDYLPFRARPGDLRRNFVYWVHEPQAAGPLGFGPSYADPETGEIVSGTAYVYGAGVDRLANNALDIIKLINGDLKLDDALSGQDVREYVMEHINADIDPRASLKDADLKRLESIPVGKVEDMALDAGQKKMVRKLRSGDTDAFQISPNFRNKQLDELKEKGFDQLLLDDETVRALSDGTLNPSKDVDADQLRKLLEDKNPFDVNAMLEEKRQKLIELSRKNVYMEEFALDAVYGTALRYADRTDYDAIYRELRNEVFRGVMLHELGHTVGLRHNFQGSYDAVNFHDEYWELRKQNFQVPRSLADSYEQSSMTTEQRDGEMPRYMYSSIMDYHSRFNSDHSGLGKYDDAAILFAYTTGTYADVAPDNADPLPQEPGYVEIFTDVPTSAQLPQFQGSFNPRELIFGYDDRYAPAQHPLEDFHYTSVVQMLGGPEALTQRSTMRYGQLRKLQEDGAADRPVEVQYMFCSDEYAGVYVSCDRWDLGADPFEIVKWAVKKYKAYYPFTHFRRDRLTFSSFSGAMAAQRTFNRFPNIYQRWLFSRSQDQVLQTNFTLAAYAGLNLLGEVMSTPSYGGYIEDPQSGTYRLASLDKKCEEGEVLGDGQTTVDLCVQPGDGRGRYTRYDYGSGYYYFTRPVEAGSYWDYVVGMGALTQSVARVIGTNAQEEFRSYLLPYYLVFDDQLTSLMNGMFRENYASFAPVVTENGELIKRSLAPLAVGTRGGGSVPIDPLTGRQVAPMGIDFGDSATPLDTSVSFSQRYRALLMSVQFFNSNFSQHYVDQMRIFKVGSGEELEADPDAGFERVTFTDPATGISYGALAKVNSEEGSLAVELVERGQSLAQAVRSGNSDAQAALDRLVEDANIMIDAVELLGNPLL